MSRWTTWRPTTAGGRRATGQTVRPEAVRPELTDIQGNIVRAYGATAMTYLFAAVVDGTRTKQWLGRVADQVTTAADPTPQCALNLGVTAEGLAVLGLPATRWDDLCPSFRAGAVARSAAIGDSGPDAPRHWSGPFHAGSDLHLVLMVAGTGERADAAVREGVARLRAELSAAGLREIGDHLEARALPGGREPFGYRDGLSQPSIEGVHDEAGPGQGYLVGDRWLPVPFGEFVLGHPGVDGTTHRPVTSLVRNGSYLVVRRLAQDVAGYRRMVAHEAQRLAVDEEWVAARIVGRWRDGTPLTRSPNRPNAPWGATPSDQEGFDYQSDDGRRCPVGAHVRRANPRGSLGFDGRLEHRHRLLRRGMPYGPPLTPPDSSGGSAVGDDGIERGLVFACYQADIENQFEFVQSEWLGDGNIFGLGHVADPLLGAHDGSRCPRREGTAAGHARGAPETPADAVDPTRATPGNTDTDVDPAGPRPSAHLGPANLVTLRGGAYFLVPGISGIRYLASLPESGAPR
ncbi:MAG: Dyp-type peroxidase [Dermatophilaceae bacterium]